ncbi:hypothetical protein F511_03533 [Dorcoceras hygrometricum]|uniref:Uncharacterized protein n=1 Tax=Dorcoceras hygrometricum TaxID=472368 RepID=A0A2Z7AHR1_9LAMI|nr:hypothetical protein F511_03533 [Dorcoceras hygrometricum]
MEDQNILAADCIIISCCCQCMILQVLIFLLLRLPQKLLRKVKQYAKKLRNRKRGTKGAVGYDEDSLSQGNSSFRIEVEGFSPDGTLRLGCCMEEVERVLVDFSNMGEFCFGSFWGGDQGSRSLSWCLRQEEIDYHDVRAAAASKCLEFGSSVALSSGDELGEICLEAGSSGALSSGDELGEICLEAERSGALSSGDELDVFLSTICNHIHWSEDAESVSGETPRMLKSARVVEKI